MKTTTKRLIKILAAALILICTALVFFISYRPLQASLEPVSFQESSASIRNPYQGWYRIYGCLLADNMNISAVDDTDNRLVLLEINLKTYSDKDISQKGLKNLDSLFALWANSDKQMIVRFLYDWDGKAMETEPKELQQILTHMTQVSKVVNRYADHIYILQGIFVGNCGEMNNSRYMTDTDMCQLIQHWASVTDSSIYLSVRTPAHWRTIAQSMEPLPKEDAFCGSAISRIGLFNDGMLGSGNDLGTYGELSFPDMTSYNDKASREDEIAFQDQLCEYVPNGGEVVLDNPFNDLENAVSDLRTMHISYLDCDYDSAVLDKWKSTIYEDKNSIFHGMSGYEFIGEHLGYRYVLRSLKCDHNPRFDKTARLILSIENNGFSNSLKKFDAILLLKNDKTNTTYSIPIESDTRFWKSQQITDITISLPMKDYEEGSYRLFFQLSDPATNETIQLANTLPLTKNGYLIGTLTLTK